MRRCESGIACWDGVALMASAEVWAGSAGNCSHLYDTNFLKSGQGWLGRCLWNGSLFNCNDSFCSCMIYVFSNMVSMVALADVLVPTTTLQRVSAMLRRVVLGP